MMIIGHRGENLGHIDRVDLLVVEGRRVRSLAATSDVGLNMTVFLFAFSRSVFRGLI